MMGADHDKCAAFILTHGRPHLLTTYDALQRCGWTRPVYFVIDDEDPTGDEYRARFGADQVVEFCKREVAARVDSGDSTGDMRTILYARNAAFDVAEQLGLDYHFQLDDDYKRFEYRWIDGARLMTANIQSLDSVVDALMDFVDVSGSLGVAMSQGGDHIGGSEGLMAQSSVRRKAMNSFVLRTDRRFQFVGRLNDDVNTYVTLGSRGKLFFTILPIMVAHTPTQTQPGGMTEAYEDIGTYAKSFTSVMYAPSCVTVSSINSVHRRIHHQVRWNNAVPKIISGTYAKSPRKCERQTA